MDTVSAWRRWRDLASATGKVLVHVGDWLQHQAALTGNDALQIGIWFDSE